MKDLIKELEFWLRGIEDYSDVPPSHPLPRAIKTLSAAESLLTFFKENEEYIDEFSPSLALYLERLDKAGKGDLK